MAPGWERVGKETGNERVTVNLDSIDCHFHSLTLSLFLSLSFTTPLTSECSNVCLFIQFSFFGKRCIWCLVNRYMRLTRIKFDSSAAVGHSQFIKRDSFEPKNTRGDKLIQSRWIEGWKDQESESHGEGSQWFFSLWLTLNVHYRSTQLNSTRLLSTNSGPSRKNWGEREENKADRKNERMREENPRKTKNKAMRAAKSKK